MVSIAFVTTCKGRLSHLRETLPLVVADAPDQIVVVDYGCPEGTGDWVEASHPGVRVVRVDDDPGFSASRARNLGAAAVDADWICFFDADIRVAPGFVAWLRSSVAAKRFFRPADADGRRNRQAAGTVVCRRSDFERAGGYDELFPAWGGEDVELYGRFGMLGLRAASFPHRFATPIDHDDAQRFVFHAIKDKSLNAVINQMYIGLKHRLMIMDGSDAELAIDTRRRLMDQVTDQVTRWGQDRTRPLPSVSVQVDHRGPPILGYRVRATWQLSMSLEPEDAAPGVVRP